MASAIAGEDERRVANLRADSNLAISRSIRDARTGAILGDGYAGSGVGRGHESHKFGDKKMLDAVIDSAVTLAFIAGTTLFVLSDALVASV